MKKVKKNFSVIPNKLTCPECRQKINESLIEKGKHKYSNGYYAHPTVKKELKDIYNNKCAFCENDTTAGAALQVEHYRPKAKVTDTKSHPGYYWLGYEWTNLLYACSKCNRAKSNSFPLKDESKRVLGPVLLANGDLDMSLCKSNRNPLLQEYPLLLNPEIDTPRDHLCYLPSGKIKGKTDKGIKTIEVCKLYRNPLVIARKKCINIILNKFIKTIADLDKSIIIEDTARYKLKEDILSDIIFKINNDESFSELYRHMLLYREYFFIRRFTKQSHKDLLIQSFNEIISSLN